MHILFIGYGKTSQRLAKQLYLQGHQISTISLTEKTDPYAQHHVQDVRFAMGIFGRHDWIRTNII